MRLENDEIIISKEEWMTNILMAGIAVQMLEKHTNKSKEQWIKNLSDWSGQQYEELLKNNPGQIEQTINLYCEVSEN